VESTERKESDLRQLEKRISKSKNSALDKLKKLLNSKFNSRDCAIKAVNILKKKLKYHQIDSIDYLEKESKEQNFFYQVNASLSENISAIKIAYQSAGRFILATNILDEESLSNDEMLSEYKAQQSCVRVACRFGREGLDFSKTPYFLQIVFFLSLQKELKLWL
jgi:hypothetical protein